jgi:hypothetical protein
MTDRKGLLLVTMEPPAAMEDEFNDWYDTEHFPQRAGLAGIESATRWACLDGWPRWLALYDLTSIAVLESAPYRAVSGANSTPWSKRILPRTIGYRRVVAEQISPGDALTPSERVARLLVACYPTRAAPEALRDAFGKLDGLLQLRLFAEGAETLWAIAAFDRPVTAARLGNSIGHIAGASAALCNLYAPYMRG